MAGVPGWDRFTLTSSHSGPQAHMMRSASLRVMQRPPPAWAEAALVSSHTPPCRAHLYCPTHIHMNGLQTVTTACVHFLVHIILLNVHQGDVSINVRTYD